MGGHGSQVVLVARAAIGGSSANVDLLVDEATGQAVHVLRLAETPTSESTVVSTVNLHSVVNLVRGRDLRIELVAVTDDAAAGASMLAFAGMGVLNGHRGIAPGEIERELRRAYLGDTALPHVLWLPAPWPELVQAPIGLDLTVSWLLALGISELECRYAEAYGAPSLVSYMASRGVNTLALARLPVL